MNAYDNEMPWMYICYVLDVWTYDKCRYAWKDDFGISEYMTMVVVNEKDVRRQMMEDRDQLVSGEDPFFYKVHYM